MDNRDKFYFSRDVTLYEYTVPHEKSISKLLKELIVATDLIDTSRYTIDSLKRLHASLNEAKELISKHKVDKNEIVRAINKLEEGHEQLEEKKEEVNKVELANLIDKVNSKISEDYTEDSWNKLFTVLEMAEETLHNEEATQEMVDQALKELKAAKKRLIEKPVGKSEFGEYLQFIKDEVLDSTKYTGKFCNYLRKLRRMLKLY